MRTTDELIWLDRVFARVPLSEPATASSALVCELTMAAAELLEHSADSVLAMGDEVARLDDGPLDDYIQRLCQAREALEQAITGADRDSPQHRFRSRRGRSRELAAAELSFAGDQLYCAGDRPNIQLGVAARRRSWWQRLLGRQPGEHGSAWSSIKQRAGAHLEPHSVWLHNSLRGGVALAIAVLVAELSNVQHGFWVVFGTLAVLRSNALSTGQDAVRALSGTVAGILVGGGLVAAGGG